MSATGYFQKLSEHVFELPSFKDVASPVCDSWEVDVWLDIDLGANRTRSIQPEEESMMRDAGLKAIVLRPGEGRPIDLSGFRMSVKATREETGGAFSLLEATEPPGFRTTLHIHHDAAEAFYVLEGEYIIFLDRSEVPCPAGSFIFIPVGMPHGFRVRNTESRKLNFYTPAAMVGYFDDLSDAAREGDVDPAVRSQIADRYSMEVIGPVPEGYD